jgi:hypothetical protein
VNGNGDTIATNNNWRDSQQAEIEATTIPPPNDLEAAIVTIVPAGAYTAIVRGFDDGTASGWWKFITAVAVRDIGQGKSPVIADRLPRWRRCRRRARAD